MRPFLDITESLKPRISWLRLAYTGRGREQARAAIRRIRERAEQTKLGAFDWSEWKSYRDEGRP
jgi:hypothetical protein